MQKWMGIALLLAAAALAGCDGGGGSDDPSKLPPLTEADKKAIEDDYAKVQQEEGANQSFGKVTKGAKPKGK